MELGTIRKVDIDNEMQQSYLNYAMSVIVARALPDAKDGLKPVQRRILYAMYDMGLRADSGYKKSARIVGEVLGKYHPHGDMAVYEAMARMAQDFSVRNLLVDGQGNFGSIDGDPPAAMRYTEARLSDYAFAMLNQLDRDTVDFAANFDETMREPVVLPAAAPNLLVNGASGIAVGMATNIPPHNLGEVVDALVFMLREWERLDDIGVSDLMQHIRGPDFPTGGIILQENEQNELQTAYATGRGRIVVRGRVQVEGGERGRTRLLITELPYLTNKSSLIERIAELAREGEIEGIVDLRDESDRQGMRIVIELSKAAETETVLGELYRRTPLQSTFGAALLALVDGEPRLLTLKQALRVYLEHRLTVIRRRSEHDLTRARQRAHVLEGLRVALKNLDEVISLIRNSPDIDAARSRLMKRFKLSEVQAQAILEMPLRRLAALERKKIETEYHELQTTIKGLESLLKSARKQRELVQEELAALKLTFADRRRTQIISLREGQSVKSLLTTKEVTPIEATWVGVMADGTIARSSGDKPPRLTGRAAPKWLLKTNSHHTLYLVAENGRAAALAVDALPKADNFADGAPVQRVSALTVEDRLALVFSLPPRNDLPEEACILTATRLGMVKKSMLRDLPGPSAQPFTLAKVNPQDALVGAVLTNGEAHIYLVAASGMVIRFSEGEVRPMGLAATGVGGIKLKGGDAVVAVETPAESEELLLVASNGRGWRITAAEFPLQGRNGQGSIGCKPPQGSLLIGCLAGKRTQAGILHFEKAAARQLRLDAVELAKRARSGGIVLPVKEKDRANCLTAIVDSESVLSRLKPGGIRRKRRDP